MANHNKFFYQIGGQYRFSLEGNDWILQHKLKTTYDKQNMGGNEKDEIGDVWYTMYKFKDDSKMLIEFQPCCSQYETDPNIALSFIPDCIIKDKDGKEGKTLSGTKFTTLTFHDTFDVKEKSSNLTDEELNLILSKEFGIVLESVIPFNSIMGKIRNSSKK